MYQCAEYLVLPNLFEIMNEINYQPITFVKFSSIHLEIKLIIIALLREYNFNIFPRKALKKRYKFFNIRNIPLILSCTKRKNTYL